MNAGRQAGIWLGMVDMTEQTPKTWLQAEIDRANKRIAALPAWARPKLRKRRTTDPTPTAREALATLIDEADNRWQHGIGAGGYDPDVQALWIADAILASGWLREVKAKAWDEGYADSYDTDGDKNPYRKATDD